MNAWSCWKNPKILSTIKCKACISSRITTVIHLRFKKTKMFILKKCDQIDYYWFNEPFAVLPYKKVYT